MTGADDWQRMEWVPPTQFEATPLGSELKPVLPALLSANPDEDHGEIDWSVIARQGTQISVIIQGTAFQTFADEMVELVLTIADLVDVKVELCFCMQQVTGPDPKEELAYLLRSDENDAYLATDAYGRIWYCNCVRQIAREIASDTDFLALSEDLLGALGCPAIGSDTSAHH